MAKVQNQHIMHSVLIFVHVNSQDWLRSIYYLPNRGSHRENPCFSKGEFGVQHWQRLPANINHFRYISFLNFKTQLFSLFLGKWTWMDRNAACCRFARYWIYLFQILMYVIFVVNLGSALYVMFVIVNCSARDVMKSGTNIRAGKTIKEGRPLTWWVCTRMFIHLDHLVLIRESLTDIISKIAARCSFPQKMSWCLSDLHKTQDKLPICYIFRFKPHATSDPSDSTSVSTRAASWPDNE